MKRAAVLGGALAVTVALASHRSARKPLIDELFHGNGMLLVGLLIAIGSYYLAHMTRGTLSGNGRFGPYGVMHGSEGIVRVVLAVVLVVVGASHAGLVRPRARAPAARGGRDLAARPARPADPRARRAVLGAVDRARLAAARLGARAGAVVRGVPRRDAARHRRAEGPRRRLHRRPLHRRASRSCCSRRCRPRCCRSSPRTPAPAATTTSARACASSC